MKKVLLIGPEFYNYNQSIERAFNNLGFASKVIGYFGNMASSLSQRIGYHVTRNKDAFFERARKKLNDHILQVYKDFQPDLVFIVHGGDVSAATVEQMKGSKRVLWMMDSISRGKELYPLTTVVDYNFFFEKTDVDFLWKAAGIGSWFLPLAVDEKVYFPARQKKDVDISFVGALYQSRIELLRQVAHEFSDYTINVYGTYYSPLRKPLYHLFRRNKNVFMNRNIHPAEVNLLYNRSRVCLNMHHSQSKYGVNQRFFEIPGSRAFQLVDTNPFIADNFRADEIMTYQSPGDMMEKIEKALRNEPEMEAMAEKAYRIVTANHTFTCRIGYVLDIIKFR